MLSMNRDLQMPRSEPQLVELMKANLNPDFLCSFHMQGELSLENFEREARRVTAVPNYEASYNAPTLETLRDPVYGNPSAFDSRVPRSPSQVSQVEVVHRNVTQASSFNPGPSPLLEQEILRPLRLIIKINQIGQVRRLIHSQLEL